ncbi:MAG: SulP family inorganic anion transporter [Halothiobacillaceae bacterium]
MTEPNNRTASSEDALRRQGNAAFQARYLTRDIPAGIITGAMAIPLSVGIAMMSDYPIKVGLATVAFAGFIGWFFAWFRPGNYIGSPGIAAGLAPILAMGVATFGIENMAFLIFLTAAFQALIWKFDWQRYILMAVPTYLVEGLLAGIGLKIFLNFLGFTYELPEELASDSFMTAERMSVIALSLVGAGLFLWLFGRFKDSKPAIPYFALIVFGVVASQLVPVSMLHVEDVPLELGLPIPDFETWSLWIYAIGFALMLAVIDVIEQVMSNSAIEKIDPLGRKTNSNNSLLAIWVANMGSSFFGGMTNLDGLAKSTTNKLAGAYTKFSVLVIALVVLFFVLNVAYLEYLPKFALGIIMMFVGWKMIMGLLHVAHHGPYALLLATFCGLLVYKVGIFEGLLIALAVHAVINYLIFRHVESKPTNMIVRDYFARFGKGEPETD